MNLFLRLFNNLFSYQKKRPDRTVVFSLLASALSSCGGGGTNMSHLSSSPPNGQKYTPSISHASSISFGLTGDGLIDGTTHGSKWDIQSTIGTPLQNSTNAPMMGYAIANGFNGETWQDPSKAFEMLGAAMTKFGDITGVMTTPIAKWMKIPDNDSYGYYNYHVFDNPTEAYNAGATIVLSIDGNLITSWAGNNAWAIGFPPDRNINDLWEGNAGDVLINMNSPGYYLPPSAYEIGGDGFTLILHELGHALGLKHPHDDGGSGRPTFSEIGLPWDDEMFTVMSYNDAFGDVLHSPAGFMLTDVLTLMYLYGVNPNANSYFGFVDPNNNRLTHLNTTEENTVVRFDGINAEVQLPNARLTDLVAYDFGYVMDKDTSRVSWLIGQFDDVVCGSGNDTIYGNNNSNIIEAGGGNDYIECYGGDDVIHGLSGADTFVMKKGWGHNIISDFEPGTDILKVVNSLGAEDNSEATYSRNSDGHAVYTLDFATSFTLFHVTSDVLI